MDIMEILIADECGVFDDLEGDKEDEDIQETNQSSSLWSSDF